MSRECRTVSLGIIWFHSICQYIAIERQCQPQSHDSMQLETSLYSLSLYRTCRYLRLPRKLVSGPYAPLASPLEVTPALPAQKHSQLAALTQFHGQAPRGKGVEQSEANFPYLIN